MIKSFICKECGETFKKKTRSYAYYCPSCFKKIRRQRTYEYRVRLGLIKKPGVGSGGNQKGWNNHQWSNFKAEYSYRHHALKSECVRCGNKENLVRHHKNHDRTNNSAENIETICRKCHSKEHNLIDNIINGRSKTTLIQGTSRTDNPEPSHSDVEGATTNRDEFNGVSLK